MNARGCWLALVSVLTMSVASPQWVRTPRPCGGTIKAFLVADTFMLAARAGGAHRSDDGRDHWLRGDRTTASEGQE